MKKMTRKNCYQALFYGTFLGSVLSAFLCFGLSYRRLWASVKDCFYSFLYYVKEFIDPESNDMVATVTQFPDIRLEEILPWNWVELARKFELLFPSLFTKAYFMAYLQRLANLAKSATWVLLFLIPFYMLISVLIRRAINQTSEAAHGSESKPLRRFKKITKRPFLYIREWLIGFGDYLRENRWRKALFFVWLLNLNIISMIVEFIAFYFYFSAAFDLGNLFVQLLKLFVDIIIMFGCLPFVCWLVIGFRLFDRIRQAIGYARLNHGEMKNRGFINSLPVVCMACGTMGAKKTTLLTDMLISTDIMFRDKALDLMFKNDMKLPNFPWQKFEDALNRAIEKKIVYNLATVEKWIIERRRRYAFRSFSGYVYGYDISWYREVYNDDLKISDMFDILETYAKLYFVYVVESSLLLSNYSVRTESILEDEGNFPLWDHELFRTAPGERPSEYAHIIDFDLFRLGRSVVENCTLSGALEFGIMGMTEIGKERQNSLELKELKKGEDCANQKNDLFNSWLKMSRHPGVIDNFTFVKVFTDEQRPESWGADARDLCVIIDIKECAELSLVMPGFLFGDLFYDLFYEKFKDMYYTVRFNRGDQTLFLYLVKNAFELFLRHYVKIYNRFGVMKMTLGTRAGTMDSEVELHEYQLAVKKVYSNRFSTDCYAEYFRSRAQASKWSLITAEKYKGVRASLDELKSQNSYFVRDLNKTFDK